jgi:hypothetical protein
MIQITCVQQPVLIASSTWRLVVQHRIGEGVTTHNWLWNSLNAWLNVDFLLNNLMGGSDLIDR